ncbi:transglutaminase family protein [Runella sp. SP2]|nr:transglutaminase family protein [Runella sp. SP2]
MKIRGKSVFKYQIHTPTTVQMLLSPRRQEGQIVLKEEFSTDPFVPFSNYNDSYENHCVRAVLPVGQLTITTEIEVLVEEEEAPSAPFPPYILVENLPTETLVYLSPSRYCQSDLYELQNLASQIVGDASWGYEQVEAIRRWIYHHVRYEYNTTYSTTTALDVVYQRVGVCRDFTHLGIALCRTLSIPARMTVGYLDKLNFMDLHAWFEAYVGDRWYTFDAVQSETHGYRVVLGYGRDAADVAMVTQFGNATLDSLEVETELLEE